MVVVMRSPLYRLIALGVSLAIAAVQQANSQSGGAVPTGGTNLVNCLAAAGSNTGAIQACKTKFQP
jgi:hypothetical protein